MRGRKPKPTATKKLAGNPGKRKLNAREPHFTVGPIECPAHLSSAAKLEWLRLAQELEAQKLLQATDRGALAAYCQSYGRWIEAEDKIKQSGPVLKSKEGGLYQNPYLSMANKAIEQMIRIGSEFGFTPASRSRLQLPAKIEDDDLERALFGNVVVADEQ